MGRTLPRRSSSAGGLDEWFDRFTRDTDVAAAEAMREGNAVHWWDILFRPAGVFLRLYVLQGGLRGGADGFIAAGLGAFSELTTYAKMWERLRGR